jgi:hypothetical protein
MLCFWFGEKSNIHDQDERERERELCVYPKRLFYVCLISYFNYVDVYKKKLITCAFMLFMHRYVQTRLGGYRNFVNGLRFTWKVALCSFLACIVLTIAALMKAKWGDSAGPLVRNEYIICCDIML